MSHRLLFLLAILGSAVAAASAQSNFSRFNFDVGGGLGLGRGAGPNSVNALVGTSYHAQAGAGINLSPRFAVSAEYLYYELPIKNTVIEQQGLLPGAGGKIHAALLNGMVKAPKLNGWLGGYGIFGIGFYARSVSNRKDLFPAGAPCQPAWTWWDLTCTLTDNHLSYPQTIASNTKDAGGFDFGGGITFRLNYLNHLHHAKVFVEARYHRAYHADVQTTFVPITVGLRW